MLTWCQAQGPAPAPGRLPTWKTQCRVLSTERESRQGLLAEARREEEAMLLGLCVSFGICVGRSLSWGWRLRWGRLARGRGVAQLLCSLPLMEDKSDYRCCLPFLLHLKAVRCEGGRFSLLRSKESSLSATLVNELASRQPWIYSCISNTFRKES